MFDEVLDDLVVSTDAELAERMRVNELERRRLDAEMSAALAVADARSLHSARGFRSMASMCRSTFNWSSAETGRRLGLSRAINTIPGLGAAWCAGRFGMSQATKLSITAANPRVEKHWERCAPALLLHGEQMPYRDFSTVVDRFVERADEDGNHDSRDAAVEGRRASVVDVGGILDVRASGGDGLEAAEMIAIFDRFVDIEYRKDLAAYRTEHDTDASADADGTEVTFDRTRLARTDRQRRFDALVALFGAAAAGNSSRTAAEPLVNIVIDAATWGRMLKAADLCTATNLDGDRIDPFTGLAVSDIDDLLGELTGAGARMCETTNGVPLHTHDVLRAALAGHVSRVVVDSERVVIDRGRRQRFFTGNARLAAKLLINRCEGPGCDLPGDWCDVDHNDEWGRDQGRTDQRNSRILCPADNVHKHRHRWTTRRALNGSSYTFRADGTIILPIGARPPDFTDNRSVGASPNLDPDLSDPDLSDPDLSDDHDNYVSDVRRERARTHCRRRCICADTLDEDPTERAITDAAIKQRIADLIASR